MEQRLERDLRGDVVDGRFRVEEKLGSGGMGTVWRVQHVVSLQRFALKTLDPTYANQEEATQRFLREARSAAMLKTRHVVRIIDAQMHHQHQGAPLPFLVMELLEGQNLQQRLDDCGRLAHGELVWLTGQLARALDAAHRQGIVHRDLKPSNVFIASDDDGQPIVKLCDFGIAKLTGDAAALGSDTHLPTRTGALLGTPMYLAPELLRGAGAAVPATDQWSMGLIGFRALAGVEYFAHVRGFPDLVLNIANDPLVPPSQRSVGLPETFDAWFIRSCARRPEERFPDAPTQAAALAQALGGPAPTPIEVRSLAATAAAAAGAAVTAYGGPATTHDATPLVARAPAVAAPRPSRPPRRMLYLAGASVWAICTIAALALLGQATTGPIAAPTQAEPPPTSAVANAPVSANPAPNASPPPSANATTLSNPHANAEAADGEPQPSAPPTAAAPTPPPQHHRRHHVTIARVPTPATAPAPGPSPPAKPAGLLPKGAACHRSAECASGLCAAESCI